MILYVIDPKVPERAKLDIFERVNAGVPLTRQQMRNSLYSGPATRFLATEAKSDLFLEATGFSLNAKTMRDREFVNRFCAFTLNPVSEYRGEMDEYLAQSLEKINSSSDGEIEALSVRFRRSLWNNFNLFGKHAFRKHRDPNQERSVLNASLWDVMSTGLANYDLAEVLPKADELRQRFYKLMADNDFNQSITYSPNSANRVRHRFAVATRMFQEVFSAD